VCHAGNQSASRNLTSLAADSPAVFRQFEADKKATLVNNLPDANSRLSDD